MAPYRDSFAYQSDPLTRFLNAVGNWSLYCGRPLFGIHLRLHWTLLLMPLLWATGSGADFLPGVLVFVMCFVVFIGSVYLHELGHAVTAMRLGYPVREVVLHMLGGVAYTGGGRNLNHEFVIVAFGPFINFVLMGVACAGYFVFAYLLGMTALNGWFLFDTPALSLAGGTFVGIGFFELLFWANLVLGVFNLYPMFPLDGSKLLRAALSIKHDANRVTYKLATFGLWVLAPAMIVYAIYLIYNRSSFASTLTLLIGLQGIQSCLMERQRAQYERIYDSSSSGGFNVSNSTSAWQDSYGESAVYGGYAEEKRLAKRNATPAAGSWHEKVETDADRTKVDALLAKISRDGINSLTAAEREFLKNASKRYGGS